MDKAEYVFEKLADISDTIYNYPEVMKAYGKPKKEYRNTMLKAINTEIKKEKQENALQNYRASKGEYQTSKEYRSDILSEGALGGMIGFAGSVPLALASQALKINKKFRGVPTGSLIIGGATGLGALGSSIYRLLKGKQKIEKVGPKESKISDLMEMKKSIKSLKSPYLYQDEILR